MQETDHIIRIAVRALAEAIHRKGGLAGPAYGGVSSADGIRLHQRFFNLLSERHEAALVQSEVALSSTFGIEDWTFLINGRCDALLELPDDPWIIEAKSFTGPREQLPEKGEPVHWAQANLYAWLYMAKKPKLQSIVVGLAYIGLETDDLVEMQRRISRAEAEAFFRKTCMAYSEFSINQLQSLRFRENSGLICRFPYSGLRTGQKRFMQEVIGAARQKSSAFIQAPTGTGKTMAALYPAVKALANHLVSHVFYLTAMTSTRLIAARALEDLRQTGLHMKYLVLYAKEKLCLEPDLYCDSKQCPYATAYYDHLPDALRQLFLLESIQREDILNCARQFKVCPFELSLDIALYCEFIICDYNHAFDPRAKLDRFFNQDMETQMLLIDEAHNLPDRSREMYSAVLDRKLLDEAISATAGLSPLLEQALGRLKAYMDQLNQSLAGENPGFDQLEKGIGTGHVLVAENYRAMRELPASLLSLLGRFEYFCRQFLDQHQDFEKRRALLDFYFSALYFSRVAEEYFDQTYVTTVKKSAGHFEISLMCLDAAEKLAKSYRNIHPAVFFSATLSPLSYYIGLLHGNIQSDRPESLLLGSPFPSDNLLVLICSSLSTRYQKRQATIEPILGMILQAARQHTGNYLIFVPSFAYLAQFRSLIRNLPVREEFDFMFQIPNMNETLRQKFLHRFERFGDRTLIAAAVMGGVFSEGIDLFGERLSGVMIIGVGLPQICPEREIMKQYYTEALGSGYEYAYLYPGFNKVQQAAGRVIRSENDRGFVLLIDDRYDLPAYTSLFPAEWQPTTVSDQDELAAALQDFWLQTDGGS